jgi:hypothetical protein
MNTNVVTIPAGIAPLISSSETGPLGIIHLPRLWLKMRYHAAGLLPEGYRHGSGGFDGSLLEAIGVEGEAFAAYVDAERPDYLTLERWVRAHARDASEAAIRAFNERTLGLQMPEPRRTEWKQRFGLTDDRYTSAIELNQLDDWATAHAQITAPDAPSTLMYPAISTPVTGPLGLIHLPRLWLKHLLHGAGRLPAEYRHGASGVDLRIAENTGFDPDGFGAFVEGERPDYLTAEAWVRRNATALTPENITELRDYTRVTRMPAELETQRRARLNFPDMSFNLGYALNQLDDWFSIHEQLIAAT